MNARKQMLIGTLVCLILGIPLSVGIVLFEYREKPVVIEVEKERSVSERTLDEITKIRKIIEQE